MTDPRPHSAFQSRRDEAALARPRLLPWLPGPAQALLATLVATAAGWPLYHGLHWPDINHRPFVTNTNVLMLYLLGVLWVATRSNRRSSILASVLSVLAFDLCFVPPYFKLDVADEQYLITFAGMLITALVISTQTHRVRAQSLAARQAWERAEAEFLRNTLLSSVSHDLRTPLAAITGAASALSEAGDRLAPGARAEMLQTLCEEAARMERLINNLLDLTRLESGGLVLTREWLPPQEVLGSALHHLRKRLGDRPTRVNVAADVPMVHVDGIALEQVLVNLIDNAIEYTPANSAIDVEVRRSTGAVQFDVADRGPGISPDARRRVFDKFYRAGGSADGSHKGIGLGLAIAKGIVELHGGTIEITERAGGGTIFRITLPQTAIAPMVDGTA